MVCVSRTPKSNVDGNCDDDDGPDGESFDAVLLFVFCRRFSQCTEGKRGRVSQWKTIE